MNITYCYLPDKLTNANYRQHNTNFIAVHRVTTVFMISYHQQWKYLYEHNKELDLVSPRLQTNTTLPVLYQLNFY